MIVHSSIVYLTNPTRTQITYWVNSTGQGCGWSSFAWPIPRGCNASCISYQAQGTNLFFGGCVDFENGACRDPESPQTGQCASLYNSLFPNPYYHGSINANSTCVLNTPSAFFSVTLNGYYAACNRSTAWKLGNNCLNCTTLALCNCSGNNFPLASSDEMPPEHDKDEKLSDQDTIAIVLAVLVGLFLLASVAFLLWYCCFYATARPLRIQKRMRRSISLASDKRPESSSTTTTTTMVKTMSSSQAMARKRRWAD